MTSRRPRPPLTKETLAELAFAYVGRFATTRAKLARYLARKLRERGWDGPEPPPVERIVERCATNGFIDDAAFALAKARSLTARGYGEGRVRQALRAAGVGDGDSEPARRLAGQEAVEAALRLARRKRIGPFAATAMERNVREKALAAMIRSGHGFALARAIVGLNPGVEPDLDALREIAGRLDD
ncbi:MAG TPA: regulatory protein RecX [Sphingomicrobium sp.]|nr:regulatory protein RecX [Sphingomicrobium sp.]